MGDMAAYYADWNPEWETEFESENLESQMIKEPIKIIVSTERPELIAMVDPIHLLTT